jgi:hypothetical protein
MNMPGRMAPEPSPAGVISNQEASALLEKTESYHLMVPQPRLPVGTMRIWLEKFVFSARAMD